MASDKELGLDRPISRRQFCQGSAVALGASLLPWAQLPAFDGSPELSAGYYPPALSGLRGDHVGAFETAHALGRRGVRWAQGSDTGEGTFDLVVVGAGISGLAAAWFWRRAHPDARILLLDNHDDFGGHATRNEFSLGDRTIIGYGGCQSIDTPSSYSTESRALLTDLAIDLDAFYQAFDRDFYQGFGLGDAFWLDRATFGVDRQRLPFQDRLLRRQRTLQRQVASLALARRMLAIWHTVHIPIGMVLFTTAFVHVGAALYYATLLR